MRRWPICGMGEGAWRGKAREAVHPHVESLGYIYELGKEGHRSMYGQVRCEWCGEVMTFAVNTRRAT